MDIRLPGMDGVTALCRLRDGPARADIKVIALAAFAMKDDRERRVSPGFDGYPSKPIGVGELPDRVRRLLGQPWRRGSGGVAQGRAVPGGRARPAASAITMAALPGRGWETAA
jgi:DNA-binding response OmpR family regulator